MLRTINPPRERKRLRTPKHRERSHSQGTSTLNRTLAQQYNIENQLYPISVIHKIDK